MASAIIGCNVPNIQKSSIINQVLLDTHKSVNNVTVLETIRKIMSRGESFWGPSIVKLGEGGYNNVYLISLVSALLLRNEANSTQNIRALIQIHSFCGSRKLPKEGSLLPYQVLNEVTCISVVASYCPDIPVPAVLLFAADSSNALRKSTYAENL
jgi:hypothetical protein